MSHRVVVSLALFLVLPMMACKHRIKDHHDDEELALVQPPLPPLHDPATEGLDRAVATMVSNFQRVHFAVDSTRLDADARAALDANAVLLGAHPSLAVEVQGHADQRGTVDYNLALGQRRAKAVVDHLLAQGVAVRQLRSVSLGEEQPRQRGAGEVAWSANRRAEFRVLTPTPSVVGTTSVSLLP